MIEKHFKCYTKAGLIIVHENTTDNKIKPYAIPIEKILCIEGRDEYTEIFLDSRSCVIYAIETLETILELIEKAKNGERDDTTTKDAANS